MGLSTAQVGVKDQDARAAVPEDVPNLEAAQRLLMATRIPPDAGTPKCASSIGAELNSSVATRSPLPNPAARSALASRHGRCASSRYVRRRSPSTTAVFRGTSRPPGGEVDGIQLRAEHAAGDRTLPGTSAALAASASLMPFLLHSKVVRHRAALTPWGSIIPSRSPPAKGRGQRTCVAGTAEYVVNP